MSTGSRDPFQPFDLTEYEMKALRELLSIGRTTAPNLSEATGVPKARIYGVLESLAEAGYIKVIPGRPKEYQPKSPKEIVDRTIENRRQHFESQREQLESIREGFIDEFQPLYEQATEDISPTEELFYVVDVGEPSERETRALYQEADREIFVITKGFEYFDRVESALRDALNRGIDVRVLFLDPNLLNEENAGIQADIVERLKLTSPEVEMSFSNGPLPWRGTFIDPTMEYDAGKAIILVGERDTPLRLRKAAITENGSFVAGLKRFFDLVWEYDSSSIE